MESLELVPRVKAVKEENDLNNDNSRAELRRLHYPLGQFSCNALYDLIVDDWFLAQDFVKVPLNIRKSAKFLLSCVNST